MKVIRDFGRFLVDIYHSKWLLYELTKHDFRARYLGSYLGTVWAVLQPIITLLIFWFIFEVGFRLRPMSDCPFIIWLMAGMVPWFYISETLGAGTNAVIEKGFLVSKVQFRASILPITKIVSALLVHLFFIGLLLLVLLYYGFKPDLHYLEIPYYMLGTILLVLGISWATSALTVFLRDVSHLINIVLQFLFWLTPIFWSPQQHFAQYQKYLKLNPFYYIIEGYRACLIRDEWFWQPTTSMIYFWVVTLSTLAIGAFVFRRLRPHFGDML